MFWIIRNVFKYIKSNYSMAETEYIINGLVVKYEGVASIEDFYKFINSELKKLGYTIIEKEHEEKGVNKFVTKGKAEKAIDEYTKLVIKFNVSSSHENVEVKNKTMQEGSFSLKLKALIERDFQDKWASPMKRFFRGIYDKYIATDKKEDYESEIKDDVYSITEKAKRYFGMHKLK